MSETLHCRVNLNAGKWNTSVSLCQNEALYRAWTDCAECEMHGLDACLGHPVCEEHAALLRTTALVDKDKNAEPGAPGRPARLLRICTLEGAA